MPTIAPIERDLIVIGGSAGALQALQELIAKLPANFPAAIAIVLHQAQSQPGHLPDILNRCGVLPAQHAKEGEPIELGRIYVAPPDFHLLVERGRLKLSRGPKENRFRPSIDPLFRTAARAYGPQVIGIILSGLLDDGTLGLMRVKQFRGIAIAQDPTTADAPDMPNSAIRNVQCDYILKPSDMSDVITQLVHEPALSAVAGATMNPPTRAAPEAAGVPSETGDTADRGDNALSTGHLGQCTSGLTCPACGGAVWEKHEGPLLTYRCHVGHAYTADSMAADHESHLEATLWEAVRMFQEAASLNRRMETKAHDAGNADMSVRYGERGQENEARAEAVRTMLLAEKSLAPAKV